VLSVSLQSKKVKAEEKEPEAWEPEVAAESEEGDEAGNAELQGLEGSVELAAKPQG
jgi:hypothetical protein